MKETNRKNISGKKSIAQTRKFTLIKWVTDVASAKY